MMLKQICFIYLRYFNKISHFSNSNYQDNRD